MNKLILLMLSFLMAVAGVSYNPQPAFEPRDNGVIISLKNVAPISLGLKDDATAAKMVMRSIEPVTQPPVEEIPTTLFCDDIPLTHDEQEWLQTACEEFDVPYALAVGLIEKETNFRNIVGDDGASTGYMQIQQKWHWGRMERLGVTNLLDPEGNFRVGCDFLSELYEKYGDWSVALTVYNMGHDPGFVTDYAKDVMANYTYWQELLENYI